MEDFIEKSPKWSKKEPIYRGIEMNEKNLRNMKAGNTVDMKGISSWSSSFDTAKAFTGEGDGKPVVFKLSKTNKATAVAHLSNYPHEKEVLMSGRSKMVIKEIKEQKIGREMITVVTLNEVGTFSTDNILARRNEKVKIFNEHITLQKKWRMDSSIVEIY